MRQQSHPFSDHKSDYGLSLDFEVTKKFSERCVGKIACLRYRVGTAPKRFCPRGFASRRGAHPAVAGDFGRLGFAPAQERSETPIANP